MRQKTIENIHTNLIVKINDGFAEWQYDFIVPHDDFSIRNVADYIKSGLDAKIATTKYINNESIDKQTAVNFAQHLLKDFTTQEVTLSDLNDFLTIK